MGIKTLGTIFQVARANQNTGFLFTITIDWFFIVSWMFSYLLFKCFLVKWTCHKHLKVIKKEIYILQASPICSHISKGSSFQVTESCTCLISGWLSTAVFPIMLLSNGTSRQLRTYPFKSERNIRNFRKIPYKLVYNRENIRYEKQRK